MSRLPNKSFNGLLSSNATRRVQQSCRIARAGPSRLNSTRTNAPETKKEELPSKERDPSTSTQQKVPNDKPIPYQNTASEWKDSSFLTPYLRKHPSLYKGFKFVYDGLGLYAKQGDSVRIGKKVYMTCSERDLIEEAWVYDTCNIPKTFHSWFQITNLHVWLWTVRTRALPPPYGRLTQQSLIDFFFQDIEDRLRSLLGPRTSERTIKSFMQEYKELWNGSTLALDIGLVGGDWELGGAVWRNCFDAKGWDLGGIRGEDGEPVSTPAPESTQSPVSPDARALGSIPSVGAASAQKGDKSLAEIPLHVYTLVGYIRRELKRLEEIPDEAIVNDMEFGEWGRMDGVGSGDEVSNAPISQSEKERWSKLWNEIGSYR